MCSGIRRSESPLPSITPKAWTLFVWFPRFRWNLLTWDAWCPLLYFFFGIRFFFIGVFWHGLRGLFVGLVGLVYFVYLVCLVDLVGLVDLVIWWIWLIWCKGTWWGLRWSYRFCWPAHISPWRILHRYNSGPMLCKDDFAPLLQRPLRWRGIGWILCLIDEWNLRFTRLNKIWAAFSETFFHGVSWDTFHVLLHPLY